MDNDNNNPYTNYIYTPEAGSTPSTQGTPTYGQQVAQDNSPYYGNTNGQPTYSQPQNSYAQPTYSQPQNSYVQPAYVQPENASVQTQQVVTKETAPVTNGFAQAEEVIEDAGQSVYYGSDPANTPLPEYKTQQSVYFGADNSQSVYSQNVQQSAYAQPTYGQPSYAQQNAYGQPNYAQPNAYGQPNYAQPNAYAQQNYGYTDPYATTQMTGSAPSGLAGASMGLGIAGLVCSSSFYLSFIGLPMSIVALILSSIYTKKAGFCSGKAKAGKITGIIGVVLGGLCVLLCSIFLIAAIVEEL